MVYRVYVEKKAGHTHEASGLLREVQDFLQIKGLTSVRVLNRYDAENLTKELFDYAVSTVFSEPQVDDVTFEVPAGQVVFAVEPLPGQFDQRADSAAQCVSHRGRAFCQGEGTGGCSPAAPAYSLWWQRQPLQCPYGSRGNAPPLPAESPERRTDAPGL